MIRKIFILAVVILVPIVSMCQDTSGTEGKSKSDWFQRRLRSHYKWHYASNPEGQNQTVYDTLELFEPKDTSLTQFDTVFFYFPKLKTFNDWYSDTIFITEQTHHIREKPSLFPTITSRAKSKTILRLVVHPEAPCYPWLEHPMQLTMEVPSIATGILGGGRYAYSDVTAYQFKHRKVIVIGEDGDSAIWKKEIPLHKLNSSEEAFVTICSRGILDEFYEWCDVGIRKYCRNKDKNIYLAQKSGVLVVFFNIEKEEAEGYLSSLRLISHKHRIRRSEHLDLPIFFTKYYCGDD